MKKFHVVAAAIFCALILLTGCRSSLQQTAKDSTPLEQPVEKKTENTDKNKTGKKQRFRAIEVLPGKTIQMDLDGDGTDDEIFYEKDRGIFVNDVPDTTFLRYALSNSPHDDRCFIVDLDEKDIQKEIMIYNEGPSYDPIARFFIVDGEEIRFIGEAMTGINTDNILENIRGDGYIYGKLRLSVLQTWFTPAKWHLNINNEVHLVEQLFYATNPTWEYRLLRPLTFYEHIWDVEPAGTLQPQAIHITSTDNKGFCYFRAQDGTEGWFQVAGTSRIFTGGEYFFAGDVIEGLNFAD